MSIEEQATNYQTMRHIERVRNLLNAVVFDLLRRGERHDQSKLASPEVEMFTKYTPLLAKMTYGSEEYERCRQEMGEGIRHHHANNPHHPEHWIDGINDMSLLDVLEMLVDWKAASERHDDGDVFRSIEVNSGRFAISPQLRRILENTARILEGK